jgi:hypothetical protein
MFLAEEKECIYNQQEQPPSTKGFYEFIVLIASPGGKAAGTPLYFPGL